MITFVMVPTGESDRNTLHLILIRVHQQSLGRTEPKSELEQVKGSRRRLVAVETCRFSGSLHGVFQPLR